MMEMDRNTVKKNDQQNDQQFQSENVMHVLEKIDVPADVDRRMDEVMENMDD
jgi:hypothetical protein